MHKSRTILGIATLSAVIMVVSFTGAAVPAAHAYGSNALWQIGLSFNCNDKNLCLQPPFGVGGFWGWVEFDTGGQGDATLAGCSHLSTSLNVTTGADSLRLDITGWTIMSTPMGPTFVLTDGTATIAGVHVQGQPVTISLAQAGLLGPTGFPAAPGHYSSQAIFGISAPPGMNFEIQVVQLTH